MKKHFYFLLPLFLFAFLLTGCQKSGDMAGDKNSSENILEMAQKTIPELEGEETKVAFSDSLSKGKEKTIAFRMRDYKNVPKNPKTMQETKDALITMKGIVDIRIIEIGEIKEVDSFHKAKEGKILKYVIYEVKGRADNPDSATIRPGSMKETGWDPAPQFVRIVDGDDKYSSSFYSRPLLKSKNYDAPLNGPKFTTADWQPAANVWEIEEGNEPILAFKYIDMEGESKFMKIAE